jgi:hypothetical protein
MFYCLYSEPKGGEYLYHTLTLCSGVYVLLLNLQRIWQPFSVVPTTCEPVTIPPPSSEPCWGRIPGWPCLQLFILRSGSECFVRSLESVVCAGSGTRRGWHIKREADLDPNRDRRSHSKGPREACEKHRPCRACPHRHRRQRARHPRRPVQPRLSCTVARLRPYYQIHSAFMSIFRITVAAIYEHIRKH